MQLRFSSDPSLYKRSFNDIVSAIDESSRFLLGRAIAVVIISGLFVSLSPIYMARVLDGISGQDHAVNGGIIPYAVIYLILRFFGQALVDLRWIVINPVLYKISYSVCALTATRLSGIRRYEGRGGDNAALVAEQVSVMSKMGIGSISLLYGLLVVILPTAIELLIVCIVVGVAIGPLLAAYMMLGGILFTLAVSFRRKKELSSANQANRTDNNVSTHFAEFISNPSLVREFSAGDFMKYRLEEAISLSVLEHRRLFFIKTERGLYLTIITCIIYAVILFWTIFEARSVAATAGSFFLLVVYLDRILQPLTNASSAVNTIQAGLVSMKGAYVLLESLKERAEHEPFKVDGSEIWDKVSIVEDRHCLQTIDKTLQIPRGSWGQIRGPLGSGKSTYLRRIYSVLLSERVFAAEQIHYLNPVPPLIRGSILENIALGNPIITREIVEKYWSRWWTDFGNRLIYLDSDVGNLSAGETQYLAICRTIIRQPKVVIFDESINSIDIQSELRIWKLIRKTLPDATVFVVSHRQNEAITFDYEKIFSNNLTTIH